MWIEIWLGGALVFTAAMGLRVTQKLKLFKLVGNYLLYAQ